MPQDKFATHLCNQHGHVAAGREGRSVCLVCGRAPLGICLLRTREKFSEVALYACTPAEVKAQQELAVLRRASWRVGRILERPLAEELAALRMQYVPRRGRVFVAEVFTFSGLTTMVGTIQSRHLLLFQSAGKGLHVVSSFALLPGVCFPFSTETVWRIDLAARTARLGGGSYTIDDNDLTKDEVLFPTGIGAFFNHSDMPNCDLVDCSGECTRNGSPRNRVWKLVVIRPVAAGEELTWDYAKGAVKMAYDEWKAERSKFRRRAGPLEKQYGSWEVMEAAVRAARLAEFGL